MPAASAAQAADVTAYNNLAGQACTQDLSGQDLDGKTPHRGRLLLQQFGPG